MSAEILKQAWRQIRETIKEQWAELTDDDITHIDGDYDRIVGALQQRYGYTREYAEQEVNYYLERHAVNA